MAHDHREMALFDIADRQLSALHAIEEVSGVIAPGCSGADRLHRRLSILLVAGPDLRRYLESAPRQHHAPLRTVKLQKRFYAAVVVRIAYGFKAADLAARPGNGATRKTVDHVLHIRRFPAVF